MKIIDAQVHIWSSGKPSGLHRQVSSFTAEEVLAEMDAAGVDAAVIHPPLGWDPQANDVAVAAARRYPDRFAILGQFHIDRPESRGLWPAAERAGLPIGRMAWRFLPVLRSIAERHPNLRLLIEHCGLVRPAQGEAALANLDELLTLASLPNVAVKATGAPHYSVQPYPFRDIHDPLHRIYDAFGPNRFSWGTDITRMPCSYRQCVTFFTEELPWLSGRDQELVMGRALCAWIDWDDPVGA